MAFHITQRLHDLRRLPHAMILDPLRTNALPTQVLRRQEGVPVLHVGLARRRGAVVARRVRADALLKAPEVVLDPHLLLHVQDRARDVREGLEPRRELPLKALKGLSLNMNPAPTHLNHVPSCIDSTFPQTLFLRHATHHRCGWCSRHVAPPARCRSTSRAHLHFGSTWASWSRSAGRSRSRRGPSSSLMCPCV